MFRAVLLQQFMKMQPGIFPGEKKGEVSGLASPGICRLSVFQGIGLTNQNFLLVAGECIVNNPAVRFRRNQRNQRYKNQPQNHTEGAGIDRALKDAQIHMQTSGNHI